MRSGWISRWWSRARSRSEAPEKSDAPALASELATLVEATRKSARAVLRLDTRLDSVAQQLASLSEDVRSLAASTRRSEDAFWSPLMDAIDRLDAARDAIAGGQVDGANAGLASIGARLEQLLAAAGYVRHGAPGGPVDGRLHRVVGVTSSPDQPEGSVARVVRAPVTREGVVVRTGEVLAVREPLENGKQVE